ncbi:hypothetical protein C8Q74DRAFT_273587 [Fomes fomentarius]|nr:hypothetical protein C8Q74DRAFT_273587 [Fomes fomentarius]
MYCRVSGCRIMIHGIHARMSYSVLTLWHLPHLDDDDPSTVLIWPNRPSSSSTPVLRFPFCRFALVGPTCLLFSLSLSHAQRRRFDGDVPPPRHSASFIREPLGPIRRPVPSFAMLQCGDKCILGRSRMFPAARAPPVALGAITAAPGSCCGDMIIAHRRWKTEDSKIEDELQVQLKMEGEDASHAPRRIHKFRTETGKVRAGLLSRLLNFDSYSLLGP